MRMIPSWILLAIIVGGGIVVVAANSLYPIAKERESKGRLAQDAKAILAEEVKGNLVVLHELQKAIENQGVKRHAI
jgi:hypothetical protein